MTPEQMAEVVGSNRKQLKQRLMEARAVLTEAVKRHFRNPTFDFKQKRLIGENGYALEWRVRTHPDLPISYTNQQTSRGSVVVLSPPPPQHKPEKPEKLQEAA